MNEPIENSYFNWLCAKVLESNTRDYETLMEILFKTEFVWVVPADAHRLSDGLELRQNFLTEIQSRSRKLNAIPCSILEVLISFANRAEFQTEVSSRDWFWQFLANLKLDHLTTVSEAEIPLIEDVLYTFTWRIYEPNGYGGLFPIEQTENDQREIEIWYQFCEYLNHRNLV